MDEVKKIWTWIKRIVSIAGIILSLILSVILIIIFKSKNNDKIDQKIKDLKDKFNELKKNNATDDDIINRAREYGKRNGKT